jgi:membrane associated rhomboid family serine protease
MVTRLLLISWLLPQLAIEFGGNALEAWLTQTFALIPAHLSAAIFGGADKLVLLTVITSSFLHADWFHFGMNALFMAMISPPLERILGARMFGIAYLLGVIAAGLAHWVSSSGDFVAAVGASGGISGLFGVFVVLFARRNLSDKIILGQRIAGSTLYILGQLALWLGIQAISALGNSLGGGGVAVWAHIGGFIFGLIWGTILRARVIKGSYRG